MRAGEPLFEIYGEQRYVLGYLPTGGLYEIKLGDRVAIETGLHTAEGIVARVEPIAAAAVQVERPLGIVIYLPLYTLLQLVLRIVRLVAIFQELIFRASYRDPYVPARVMRRAARV